MKRRDFLKAASGAITAGAALGFPTIVRASALGKAGRPSAGNRIAMGFIGMNWMGMGNLDSFLSKQEVQAVAVCDIDKNHLNNARNKVDGKYGNKDCIAIHDFRELLGRGDLDAVMLALPDHWHAIPAIMAAKAGLDIYGEKPFSHSLLEGRAMCNAVKRYGRIWQTGSWQRSVANFHQGCELVRNGRIGKVHTVEVGLGNGHADFDGNKDQMGFRPPPPELDYDMWIGPAPWEPYCPARVHKSWRWHMDYGGGMLMDWIGHHGDIAHWGLGLDNTGPVEIEATGDHPDGLWNTPKEFDATCKYADGVIIRIGSQIRGGTKWIGDKGWVFTQRGEIEAEPKSLLNEVIGPEEVRLYKSTDHQQNFLDCMKSRQETITPAETAHRSASVGHLCMISIKLGRKLKWDPEKEEFPGDPDAQRLLGNAYRGPWELDLNVT
jgi:predicted dehydrogenase